MTCWQPVSGQLITRVSPTTSRPATWVIRTTRSIAALAPARGETSGIEPS